MQDVQHHRQIGLHLG